MSDLLDSTIAELRSNNVAIVGLQNSGKTVLLTVLSKMMGYEGAKINGCYLVPQLNSITYDYSSNTKEYIDRIWVGLKDNKQWPPSTPPGVSYLLGWDIVLRNKKFSEIRMCDAPGQDMHQILVNGSKLINVEFENYLSTSFLVVMVINAESLKSSSDSTRRLLEPEILAMCRSLIDSFHKEIFIVVTAHDPKRHGANIGNFIQELCPDLAGFINMKRGSITLAGVCPVPSVPDPSGSGFDVPNINNTSQSLGLQHVAHTIISKVQSRAQSKVWLYIFRSLVFAKSAILTTLSVTFLALFISGCIWGKGNYYSPDPYQYDCPAGWHWLRYCNTCQGKGTLTYYPDQEFSASIAMSNGTKWAIYNFYVYLAVIGAFSIYYYRQGYRIVAGDKP